MPLSRRKLWLFRVAVLFLAPALVLGLLEAGLRLAGFGYATGFFVDGPAGPVTNPRFGWQYFPPAIARVPAYHVLRDAKQRAGDAEPGKRNVRVFVLGGSAAMGYPELSLSMGRVLERMLQQRHPEARIEVINAAMIATNSHVAVQIARDCAKHEPDVMVVYCGNNEVVGPYGAGTVFAGYSPSLPAIRTGILVRKTRVGQAMRKLLGSGGGPALREWTGPALFADKHVTAGSEALEGVYRHLGQNLRDICEAGRRAGATVVLSTVVTNLRDCPPFQSVHRAEIDAEELERWQELYRRGAAQLATARHEEAASAFAQASAIDDSYAELRYLRGRALWALGRHDEARDEFIAARDLDALRLRADTRINRIIREVAAERRDRGVVLVDVVDLLGDESPTPHGAFGSELLLEYVHLNFAGNYAVARHLLGPVERSVWPEASSKDIPSLDECADLLAFTGWHRLGIARNVLALTDKAPFTEQHGHTARVAALRANVERLAEQYETPAALARARERFERILEDFPEDLALRERYADLLGELKDHEAAAGELRKLIAVHPGASTWHVDLASHLRVLGDAEGAWRHHEMAIQLNPYDADAHWSYGVGRLAERQLDRAIQRFEEALEINPRHLRAHVYLGVAHTQNGQEAEAIEDYRRALSIQPDAVAVRRIMAGLCIRAQRYGEAREQLKRTLEQEPDFVPDLSALGQIHLRAGRAAEAAGCFRRWLRLKPDSAKARKLLERAERAAGLQTAR